MIFVRDSRTLSTFYAAAAAVSDHLGNFGVRPRFYANITYLPVMIFTQCRLAA